MTPGGPMFPPSLQPRCNHLLHPTGQVCNADALAAFRAPGPARSPCAEVLPSRCARRQETSPTIHLRSRATAYKSVVTSNQAVQNEALQACHVTRPVCRYELRVGGITRSRVYGPALRPVAVATENTPDDESGHVAVPIRVRMNAEEQLENATCELNHRQHSRRSGDPLLCRIV